MSDSKKNNEKASVECAPDGPYLVKNLEGFKDIKNRDINTKPVMALCRCGKSEEKPFCDGTHTKVGFKDNKETDGEWDKRVDYTGKKIVIHDNRGICSHAGFCTSNLPSVFLMGVEPWIDPDQEDPQKIIETIKKCPSGALSYSINNKENRDQERASAIKMSRNGPYCLEGSVELKNINKGVEASDEHFALCRCGGSKNKPFCDGTHWHISFRDDSLVRIAMPGDLKEGLTPVTLDGIDLVIIKQDETISVFSGKCLHQGAMLADGYVDGKYLTCGLHGWRYEIKTGELEGDPGQCLKKLTVTIEEWDILIDRNELNELKLGNQEQSQPLNIKEEPYIEHIHALAKNGLKESHGPIAAMGVLRKDLPNWDDLQILTAQLIRFPLNNSRHQVL